ncbi:MAG: FtsX-like permease family protein [Bryobacterales bacterium]|nr:FtsX-like permease family protein [Bryobacterales bacterium]
MNYGEIVTVRPFREVLAEDLRGPLSAFALGCLFVLVTALANSSSLLFAQANLRRKEMAVRHALGATSGRIMAQVLMEGVLIGSMAGAVGVTTAMFSAEMIHRYVLPMFIPLGEGAATVGGATFVVAGMLSLICGVVIAVAAAAHAARADVLEALKDWAALHRLCNPRVRRTLVALQVSAAIILTSAAGRILIRLKQVAQIPLGFSVAGSLTGRLEIPTPGRS